MANQSFLVCSARRIALPIHHEPGFAVRAQVVACGDWCVRASSQALAEVAVNGTAAQLDAILKTGGVNLSKRIKAAGYGDPAPAAETEPSRVEAGIKTFINFVRALSRSGIEEARGREAEILAKQDANARQAPLEPYPFR